MAFDTAQLPTPSAIDESDATVVLRSSSWQTGALLLSNVPDDSANVRQWTLNYQDKPAAVLATLRAHYRTYIGAAFEWTPPGETTAHVVMHREPPALEWINQRYGNARVFLEEPMAHDL